MPLPRRSNLSRQSRNVRRRRNIRKAMTEEQKRIVREEGRVRRARFRASQSQEQREVARETARLAMRNRRARSRYKTHKQPVIDYESVREKAAIQKRDIEKALTKFLAKTIPTHNLFETDEANIFPLIAFKPSYPPYLSALMPMDQIFDNEDLELDPKSQILQQQKNHDKATKKLKTEIKEEEDQDESMNDSFKSEDNASNTNYIDNPYLAATKLPSNQGMDVS